MLAMIAAAAMPASWTLAVGGDVMLNGISAKTNPMKAVAPFLSRADIALLNLEIPLTTAKTITPRKSIADRQRKAQFVLKADPAHAAHLAALGIDGVSLGNNHDMDYGPKGLAEMLAVLDKRSIAHTGAGANEAQAQAPVGVDPEAGGEPKIAMLSFLSFMSDGANNTCWPAGTDSPGLSALKLGGTVDAKDRALLARKVKEAEKVSPFVVVMIHWGLEKQTLPTPYQVALGRAWIDAGADAVIGHHPHVLQGAELYNGKPIFYSIGNFISPRPAATALFKLRFEGETLKTTAVLPCGISGGKVAPYPMPKRLAELKRFRGLSEALARRYKSPKSRPLPVVLATP